MMGYREFNHDFYEYLIRKRIVMSSEQTVAVKVQVYREFIKEVAISKLLPDTQCFFERVLPKYLPRKKKGVK